MAAAAVLAYSLAGGAFRWQAEEPIGVDWWAETASRYAVCAAARWLLARCGVDAYVVAAVVLVAYASVRNYVVAVSKEPRRLAEYRLGPLP